MKTKPKHAIKDSVFKNLFSDKKYLLQLYLALHPEDSNITEDDIHDVTIKPVLMEKEYNDLGFSVGNRIITLIESQSTWSINIIIRAIFYLADTYQEYISRTKQNVYGSKKVTIPAPELYVIYTGEKENIPDSISLCNEYFNGKKYSLDATVTILSRINDNDIISQYISFCKIYDEQRKKHGRSVDAIIETMRICQDRSILKDYLQERESEVIDIMIDLFSEENLSKAYDEDLKRKYSKMFSEKYRKEYSEKYRKEYLNKLEKEKEKIIESERKSAAQAVKQAAKQAAEQAAAQAKQETAKNTAYRTALNLLNMGKLSYEEIAAATNLSVEEVEELNAGKTID